MKKKKHHDIHFPTLSAELRKSRLTPPACAVRMVLDTDTYNEIDDQFALAYALLSPEKLHMEAVYAAPFQNIRSAGPEDGMEKSYQEILRILELLDHSPDNFAFRGATHFLSDEDHPADSNAVHHLIKTAMACPNDAPLYVVAIAAITNIASALLLEPELVRKIVVVWLGGQPLYWPDTKVFNVVQDVEAARIVLDSGVPLVHIPCSCVASHLLTTAWELEQYVRGRGAIGDFLTDTFEAYKDDHRAWAKELWDMAPVAWLIKPGWVPSQLDPTPILTEEATWAFDENRPPMRSARFVFRNPIFRDFFDKLEQETHTGGTL